MALLPRRSWNHNTRYHRLLLRRIPPTSTTVLDVGCGDGTFVAALCGRGLRVTGLDRDESQVAMTRRRVPEANVVLTDLFDFKPSERFDVVTGLAVLHHLPFEAALRQMAELLNPGGRLLLLGVWTDSATYGDLVRNLAGTATNSLLRRLWGPDVMDAPQTMPTMKYRHVSREAQRVLPGVSIRRLVLWRYALDWQKP